MIASSTARILPSGEGHSIWRNIAINSSLLYTIIFNPVLVLHALNSILSFVYPTNLGSPTFNSGVQIHLDVHAHDGFCRLFTLVMVALQSALYFPHKSRTPQPTVTIDYDDNRGAAMSE